MSVKILLEMGKVLVTNYENKKIISAVLVPSDKVVGRG